MLGSGTVRLLLCYQDALFLRSIEDESVKKKNSGKAFFQGKKLEIPTSFSQSVNLVKQETSLVLPS